MLEKFLGSEKGLSLMEVVLAMALLGIAATGLLAAMATGLRVGLTIDEQTLSASAVTAQLEDTLSQSYVEPPDYPSVTVPDGFFLSFDNFVVKPTLLERITVAISTAVDELFNITTHKVNTEFEASPPKLLLSQRDYRWFQNVNSVTTTSPLADENTPYVMSSQSQVVRLRMSVQADRLELGAGSQSFKLQYATVKEGPWTDVGAVASSTQTWRGFDNPGPSNGDPLFGVGLTHSDVAQTYQEENPTVPNPNVVPLGDWAEWDWVIQENGAAFNTSYLFRMVRADGSALESYTRFPVLTMPSPTTFTQTSYAWFANADSQTPAGALASERSPFTATAHGEVYRLRINVEIDGTQLVAGQQAFKLQHATSTAGPWSDVGALASAATWRGFDNPSVADGATISSLLITSSDVKATYEEANPSALNPNPIAVEQRAEWDWVIQDNGAEDDTDYFFRMVLAAGAALDSYAFYPKLTTAAPEVLTQQDYQWYENTDGLTPTVSLASVNTPLASADQQAVFRLRMNVEVGTAGLAANAEAFKLQYSTSTQGTWSDVGGTTSTAIWRGADNPTPADGATLPGLKIATSTVAQSYEETNPSVANPTPTGVGDFAEWDWVLQNNGAQPETTYVFRMVKTDGTPLDSYVRYPEVTTAAGGTFQGDWRWFLNRNHQDPVVPLGSENTPVTGITSTAAVRLRVGVSGTGAPLDPGAQAFKLQYSTSTAGGWRDIGAIASTEFWRGFDNALVADGETSISLVLSNSNVTMSYEEENPSVPNPNGLSVGDIGEWDWVLQNFSAPAATYFFRMVEADGTPLAGYSGVYPQITTIESTLTQRDYRWFTNVDAPTPTTPLAPVNASTTGATPGTVFRIRMNVGASDTPLPQDGQIFKLQFTGGSTSTGPWLDVGVIGSDSIWRGFDNATPADGATLPSLLLASSTVDESYEEDNPSAVNPAELGVGDLGEWDWVVQNRLAPSGTYFFRMVKSDGSPLEGYSNYPEVTAAGPSLTQEDYRWYANQDAITPTSTLSGVNTPFVDAQQRAAYRLRMNVEVNDATLLSGAETFKLQYATDTTGPWTDVGAITSTVAAWRGFDNAGVADGAVLTALLPTSTVAATYEEANPSAPNPSDVSIAQRAEWDWVVQPNQAAASTTYFFRMVRSSGDSLEVYTRFPTLTTPPASLLTQHDYRWFGNQATTTPAAALQGENVAHTGALPQDVFRLRMNVGVADADLGAGSRRFRLQYAVTSSAPVLPWRDVGGLPPLDIVFDAVSSGSGGGGTTLTISHTVGSQSNRVLVVGAEGEDGSATDCVTTGVTYNGVAMTRVDEAVVGTTSIVCVSLWYLLAPSIGTHDIVITWAGNVSRRKGGGTSIYNAAQQAPEAQNKQTNEGFTTIATSVNTVTDGAWLIDAVGSGTNNAFATTEPGQTERYDVASGTSRGAGSTRLAVTAGANSMGWSQNANRLAHVVAAFTPFSETQTFDRIWRGFDNATVADGQSLQSILLSSSDIAESYEEVNPTVSNPRPVSIGQRGEWDWVVQDNGAPSGSYIFRMVDENGNPLGAYVNYPEIAAAAPAFDQKDFQWYLNEDSADPSTSLGGVNAAVATTTRGLVYRLRMNVEVGLVELPLEAQQFKLQYATSTGGPWTDVGLPGSGGTWRGLDNPGVADGALVTTVLPTSTVAATYEEGNPSALNPNAVPVAERAEWDWVLQPNGADDSAIYYFRMVASNGVAFGAYTRYPSLTTPPPLAMAQRDYQWWKNRNNITPNTTLQPVNVPHSGVTPLTILRIRMNVESTGANLAPDGQAFKLQYATSTGGPWRDVGAVDSAGVWRGDAIGGATTIDGDPLPVLLLASSTLAATFEEANPSAANPNAVSLGDLLEWDWVVQSNSAPTGTYFFRMVLEDGTAFGVYTHYPEVTTAGPTLTQLDYRWFSNVDNNRRLGPPLAAINSPYTQASSPDVIRLRVNVLTQDNSLPQNGQAFKLQYAATTTGPWTDLGDIASGSAWRGFDNLTAADGDRTRGTELGSDVRESYEEQNPTVPNPAAINVGSTGEWDWVIQNNNAPSESVFVFRMVRADGASLDAYSNYPQVTTTRPVIAFDNFESGGFAGGAGWLAPWATSGDVAVTKKGNPQEGLRHMRLRRDTGQAERTIDLSGEDQVDLQFWAKAKSFEPGETATLSVSDNGADYTIVRTWVDGDDDNAYHFYSFNLNSYAPVLGATYWIRFKANMSGKGDHLYVDDLKVIGQ